MTILFKDDWNKFPDAIMDYKTSNKSFLRMVGLYQQMGVANCAFPLILLQRNLQGVDPFDENLTDEQKVAVGLECKYNFLVLLTRGCTYSSFWFTQTNTI